MHIKIFHEGKEKVVLPIAWDPVVRPGLGQPPATTVPLGTVIETEYGPGTLARAVRRCRFAVKDIAVNMRSMPEGCPTRIRYEVCEQSFFGEAPAHVVLHSVIQTYGLGFADPHTALEVARRFLRRHPFNEFVTLFSLPDRGQVCEMAIGDDEGGLRLSVRTIDLERVYDRDTRFLTVRRLHE